jgi:hypothetical protein
MDEETLTVWLDTALLMLGGFILMTVLMMAVVNLPAQSGAAWCGIALTASTTSFESPRDDWSCPLSSSRRCWAR